MSEKEYEAFKRMFRAKKESMKTDYPDRADDIGKAETIKQLYTIHEEETAKQGTEKPDEKKLVVEHYHKVVKDLEDDDEDLESLRLDKTGGSVLLRPTGFGVKDLAASAENMREMVKAVYDEHDKLRAKEWFGKMTPAEKRRYEVIKAKRDAIFGSVIEGMKTRRQSLESLNVVAWNCPLCGKTVSGSTCECGYRYGKPITEDMKRKAVLKGA